MIYEFNLDGLTIRDWLILAKIDKYKNSQEDIPPALMEEFLSLIDRHTNTNVLELPASEMSNLLTQFVDAMNYQFGSKK